MDSQSACYGTAVIGDSSTCRFVFEIIEPPPEKSRTANHAFTIKSDNPLVLPEANIKPYRSPEGFVLQIDPIAEGYCSINLQWMNGDRLLQQTLELAVSKPGAASLPLKYYSGLADASAILMLNGSMLLVADDEENRLAAYRSDKGGAPVWQVSYDRLIPFSACRNDRCDEADLEAAVRSPSNPQLLYFFGSMSNGKEPKSKHCANRSFFVCGPLQRKKRNPN